MRFGKRPRWAVKAAIEDLPNTQRLLWALKNVWVELLEDGVTTMRDAGSKDYLSIELRNVFNEGMFKGPRIIATGAGLAITGGHGARGVNSAMEVDGADEIRKAVRALLKAGADWIKLKVSGGISGIHKGDHPSIVEFTEEEVRTAVEEAHKRNRRVMVHGMAAESVKMAVRAGVDCIEHGNLLDDEAIAMMKKEGVFFVPTMSVMPVVYERERTGGNEKIADMLWEVISPHREVVSKSDALAAATINSATILGLEEEIGSIEKGKIADLVVLEGNPVEDLSALGRIRQVIIGGEVASWELLINAKRNTDSQEKRDS